MSLRYNRPAGRDRGRARRCLAAAMLAALACAGAARADEPPAGGAAAAASVKPDPALADLLPPEIRERRTLLVGAQMQQPPEDFYAADGRTPIGFEVDLMRAIAGRLGLAVEYRVMAFDALIPSLRSGRADVIMSAMNDTKTRQKTINFVDYFNAGITMLAQKGNPERIAGPDSLCGKSVSVQSGTTQQSFAEEQNAKCQAQGKAPVSVVVSSSTGAQEQALRTGRFAVILDDTPTAVYTAQVAGGGRLFEAIDHPPINGAPYGIGIGKDNETLTAAIQKTLQSLIDDGTYGKILGAWNMGVGAVPKATVNGG